MLVGANLWAGGDPHLCPDRAVGPWGLVLSSLPPGSEPSLGQFPASTQAWGCCVPTSLSPLPIPTNRSATGQGSEHLYLQNQHPGEAKVLRLPTRPRAHAAHTPPAPLQPALWFSHSPVWPSPRSCGQEPLGRPWPRVGAAGPGQRGPEITLCEVLWGLGVHWALPLSP